jgi:hypothetical protein
MDSIMMRALAVLAALFTIVPIVAQAASVGEVEEGFVLGRPTGAGKGPPVAVPFSTVNPRQYGAICDGSSHKLSTKFGTLAAAQAKYPSATSLDNEIDGVAINKAFDQVRAFSADGTGKSNFTMPAHSVCLADISIDGTMIRNGVAVDVNGNGGVIITTAAGKVAFDMRGSQRPNVHNLTVYSPSADTAPRVGFLIGRYENAGSPDGFGSSDSLVIDDVTVYGFYTLTSAYNAASEDVTWVHPFFQNMYVSSSTYAFIGDGQNYWGTTSDYVNVTLSANAQSSMTQNIFIGGEFRNASTGPAVWLSGTRGWQFNNGYFLSTGTDTDADSTTSGGTSACAIELHSDIVSTPFGPLGTPTDNVALEFNDVHVENPWTNTVFCLTGSNPTPRLEGFTYKDAVSFPPRIFTAGPSVTTAYILDAQVHVPLQLFRNYAVPDDAVTIADNVLTFDDPTKFVVSGNWFLPKRDRWNDGVKTVHGGKACFNNTAPVMPELCRGVITHVAAATSGWSTTGATTEKNLKVVHLPRFGPNDSLRIHAMYSRSSLSPTDSVRFIIRLAVDTCDEGADCSAGTVVHDATMNTSGLITDAPDIMIYNRNATNSQRFFDGVGSAPGTAAIETGGGANVLFNCVLASATDTCTLEGFSVEAVPSK